MSDFEHQLGLPSTSFTDHVGIPTIQYYSSADTNTGLRSPDDAFINIPHMHAGRDKYGAQDIKFRRLLHMTMQMTFVITQIAMDTIELLPESNTPPPTRLELCETIIASLNNLLNNTINGRVFMSRFKAAKRDAKQWLSGDEWRLVSEDVRPVLGISGGQRLAGLGKAVGEPDSLERRRDLNSLWETNFPDLHLIVPRDESRREEWMELFLPLQEGQFYFLAVLSRLPVDEHQKALLKTLRPDWQGDDSWMANANDRTSVVLKSGLWAHKTRGFNRQGRLMRPSATHPDIWRPAKDMQGSPIGISVSKGKFVVRWLQPDGSKVSLRLNAAFAIPARSEETRALSFTKDGLDIIDADGTPIRSTAKGKNPPLALASIPRTRFLSTEPKQLLIDLWKAVLACRGIDTGEADIVGKDWPKGKGVDRIPRHAKAEKPRQNRPPEELDANYLLDCFLSERFPEGGLFRTAPSTRPGKDDSTEDLQAFVAFIKQPEYRKHPYTDSWLADLDRPTPMVAVLESNLQVLRSMRSERDRAWSSTETKFLLGPPGTATAWANTQPSKGSEYLPATRRGPRGGRGHGRGSSISGGAPLVRKRKTVLVGEDDDDVEAGDPAEVEFDDGMSIQPRKQMKSAKPLPSKQFAMEYEE
jgi:hypothetical protein